MAPFFASNGITRTGDLPAQSFFIPRPDFTAGSPTKDPRSPLTGPCSQQLSKQTRPILSIDTTCADAQRIKALGADSLVAKQGPYPVDNGVTDICRPFQDAALDNAIDRVFRNMEGLSPALPSSETLSYGSPFGADIPGEAATADMGAESAVSSLDITIKKRSWRTGNLDEAGFGAWPEKKVKKVRTRTLQADWDSPFAEDAPQSADITDEKRVLHVVNPDPASGKSSAGSASFRRSHAPEPESPFIDHSWKAPQYSQRVVNSMRGYNITSSKNPRSVEEPVSPKSGPRRTVARVPSVMQPRHRHSCYACNHKREMAEMAGKK